MAEPARATPFVFRPFKFSRVKYRSGTRDTPRPRSGHRIVCHGSRLFCFGGYNPTISSNPGSEPNPLTWSPDRPLFKELWTYSVARRKWELLRMHSMPDELASNVMCVSGPNILIFGGTGSPFGQRCSNNVLLYSTSARGSLKHLPTTGQRPPGQYGQAAVCKDNYFYSVGGTNGFSYTCDVYRLSLETLKWEALYICHGGEGEPFGRYRHELANDGSNIYVLAGGTGEWAFELQEVPVFNIETKTWSVRSTKYDHSLQPPSAPLPRKCHSAVQMETENGVQVFVMGGSDGMSVFDDVWRLDLPTMQWTLMSKTVLPKLLYFHSSAITPQGCVYTFGGIEPSDEAGRRNNNMYKVWLRIPKLSEMCWEAVLHYNPDLDMIHPSKLLNSGVPRHFVERLGV